jgi:hypothetical protein
LADQAGIDPAKQKECLDALLVGAQPLFATLQPFMLSLVEAELQNVAMSPAGRAQLCKLLAAPLGVRASVLEESFSPGDLPPDKKLRFEETIEPWAEPVDGAQLLDETNMILERFIVVKDQYFVATTLWLAFLYLYDLFYKLPILRIKSPQKGCGKSTLLDVIELLAPKPLLTVSISPPGLYRIIEKYHPTVLIDEADSYGKEDNDLRNIVCGGYERNRPAARVNKETMEVEFFDTFGCKALASIGELHETIEDRSIMVDMERKGAEVEVEELCDADQSRFVELRRKYQRWTNDIRQKVQDTHVTRPKFLHGRSWDKWRPLLTIAQVAGGDWFKLVMDSAREIVRDFDSELNLKTEVLFRIRALFRERKKEFLPTDDIINHLNDDKEAPWADWHKGDKKGLTPHKLSSILKPFKVKSDYPRVDGKRIHGYWLKDFKPAFDGYLTPEETREEPNNVTDSDDAPL